MSVSEGSLGVVERATPPFGRTPPWRWRPWPPAGATAYKAPPTDEEIQARSDLLAQRRPWCTDEQNLADARLELNGPMLLRWRPSLLRWLGASEKTGWEWMELSLKLSVPLTIALGGWFLGTLNSNRQNVIAQENQKDAVIREYIKEMKGMLLDKEVAKAARQPGTEVNGVARALTLTALSQLKGEASGRRSLVFQFLRESGFQILAGDENTAGADLTNYDLRGTRLDGANLVGSVLFGADLRGASFIGSDLRNSIFYGANLKDVQFGNTNLSGADLTGANLRGISFGWFRYARQPNPEKPSNLSDANLSWADLSGARLSGAVLRKANLFKANLSGANLMNTNLSGAGLGWAKLSGANLIDADLSRAILSGANLDDADLSAANLSEADLKGVQWDGDTKWPNKVAFLGARNIPPQLKKQLGLN